MQVRYYLILLFTATFFYACNQSGNSAQLQLRIDSLEKEIDASYKPGLGEFMSQIQVHHAKLWFAGKSKNWKLADFEIHEIMESLDDIQQYAAERPESKKVIMLQPAIDSVNRAIKQKDTALFKGSFELLTATCNNCHNAVEYDFNKVKIPEIPPLSNQVFTPSEN